MYNNLKICSIVAVISLLFSASSVVSAQEEQTVEAYIGTFMPHGLDGRSYVDDQIPVLRSIMQICYENHLELDPDTTGLVLMQVFISANGEIINVDIMQNRTGSEDLANCVETDLEILTLEPNNRENASIMLPVTFRLRCSNYNLAQQAQNKL